MKDDKGKSDSRRRRVRLMRKRLRTGEGRGTRVGRHFTSNKVEVRAASDDD